MSRWLDSKWLWVALSVILMMTVFASSFASAAPVPPAEPAPAFADSEGITGFFRTIGMIGILILILSLVLVGMIVWLLLDLRSGVALPLDFVEVLEDALSKRRYKEAFDLSRSEPSMIGRVLTAGMARMQYGLEEARSAAESMTESMKARKDHVVSYMATIGTLGPLFGLVGTVYGMILSFGELGKGGTPNPGALAGGISHALYVTLLGISLSLPAIFFYSFFRNRIARNAIDISLMADDLLTQMFHNSRRAATETTGGKSSSAPATVKAPEI